MGVRPGRSGLSALTSNLTPSNTYSVNASRTVGRNADGKVVSLGSSPSGVKPGKSPSTGANNYQKADSIFSALNLGAMLLFFLPFGGSGSGTAAGEEFSLQQALPSFISCCCVSMMMSMVLVLVVMM